MLNASVKTLSSKVLKRQFFNHSAKSFNPWNWLGEDLSDQWNPGLMPSSPNSWKCEVGGLGGYSLFTAMLLTTFDHKKNIHEPTWGKYSKLASMKERAKLRSGIVLIWLTFCSYSNSYFTLLPFFVSSLILNQTDTFVTRVPKEKKDYKEPRVKREIR